MKTEQELSILEALANAATPPPWDVHEVPGYGYWDGDGFDGKFWDMADAAFIAAARTAVPELIAEVRRLYNLLERCKPYIGHMPDCIWFQVNYRCDCGRIGILAEIGACNE